MDWYYTVGGVRKGPHSPAEFQQLVQQGVITSQTLVWHLGMEEWQPYDGGDRSTPPPVAAPLIEGPPIASAPAGHLICADCEGVFPINEVISLANRSYCAACKPLAVQRLKEGVIPVSVSAADDIRKQYLKHEASIKSVGFLYFLGGIGVCIAGTAGMLAPSPRAGRGAVVLTFILFGLGIGQFCVGYGLRGLKPWARVPSGILSGLGLLAVPVGTLINAYILYLIFSKKGKMVFSDEYHDIIRQTPHINYRTSIVIWFVLVLLLALMGFALLGAFMARR